MFFQERQNTKIGFGLFFASPEFCMLSPHWCSFSFFLNLQDQQSPRHPPQLHQSLSIKFRKSSHGLDALLFGVMIVIKIMTIVLMMMIITC